MLYKNLTFLSLLLASFFTQSQNTPSFDIFLEALNTDNIPGTQAFAYGQYNGYWLIVGGRADGLHRRQPFASFDAAGRNSQLRVIEPTTHQSWTASLSQFPASIREQLSATNMEFFQEGDYLYLIGGYGYSETADDHITYPNLAAVHLPSIIQAIIQGNALPLDKIRQITDQKFAVTGGYVHQLYGVHYLVGGQRFEGRYNPMNGPSFTQTYTDAIRRFSLADDGIHLVVTHLPEITDPVNLHRRDYNVAAQIMPNGEEGLTAFSGVFRPDFDLPFLNAVNIDSSGHRVVPNFLQYYNHYHCAHIPLYDASNQEMHTLFFGGIAQYYDSLGVLVQDNDVPFVRTIARVTRDASGAMSEYKLPVEMPALLGAGSEFIPSADLAKYTNGVLKMDAFSKDTTFLGYIYGGIESQGRNIFWINDGNQSSASSRIFKVFLTQKNTSATHQLNSESINKLNMEVFPNPSNGDFTVKFDLDVLQPVIITLSDISGKTIMRTELENLIIGTNNVGSNLPFLANGGVFYVQLETPTVRVVRKIIIEP